jgi:hypothetical protein
MNRPGRPSNGCVYSDVEHNGKEYTVGTIRHNGEPVRFVIDKEDRSRVEGYSWHVTTNNYISATAVHDGRRKALFLHNLIMNREHFGGKGQAETIDHINRNGFDNRKENLRIASQTDQNINQRQKPRTVNLPADCGVAQDDIPRHIWYVRANGAHGDRFAIEFKSENLVWKSTSSKAVSTRAKLEEASAKLQELYTQYPHLNPNNPVIVERMEQLSTSFAAIIS